MVINAGLKSGFQEMLVELPERFQQIGPHMDEVFYAISLKLLHKFRGISSHHQNSILSYCLGKRSCQGGVGIISTAENNNIRISFFCCFNPRLYRGKGRLVQNLISRTGKEVTREACPGCSPGRRTIFKKKYRRFFTIKVRKYKVRFIYYKTSN